MLKAWLSDSYNSYNHSSRREVCFSSAHFGCTDLYLYLIYFPKVCMTAVACGSLYKLHGLICHGTVHSHRRSGLWSPTWAQACAVS